MKINYDLKCNVGYLTFKDKKEEVNSIKLSEDLIIDMAPDGTIYGIELLNVKEQIFGDNLKQLLLLNENTGKKQLIDIAA